MTDDKAMRDETLELVQKWLRDFPQLERYEFDLCALVDTALIAAALPNGEDKEDT